MTGTVLLTGGSGFIGRHLAGVLARRALPVRYLQRPAHDLLAADGLHNLCQGVELILHLASYAHVNQVDKLRLHEVNVTGTRNLLTAAIAAGVPRFVYVSSILADPAYDQPPTAYGQSKREAEQLLIAAHQRGHIQVCILRPVNVYGPGMKGNLMTLMRLIRTGWLPPLPRFAAGFSLIGVDDLCCAIMQAADYMQSAQGRAAAPGVFPLTDGQHYTLKAVEQAIRRASGQPQHHWATPAWLFYLAALAMELAGRLLRLRNAPGLRSYRAMTRNFTVDDSASRLQLGYNPERTFYQALPAIIAELTPNQRDT
jgi:UDP-glucose 4-epimerase